MNKRQSIGNVSPPPFTSVNMIIPNVEMNFHHHLKNSFSTVRTNLPTLGQNTSIPEGILREKHKFQAFPSEIIFKDFEPFQTYQSIVSIRNNDVVARRLNVYSPKSRFFKVIPTKKNLNSNIAPGLDVSYQIIFSPEEKIDYTCDLIVKTETEEFSIPIIAIGLRAQLDIPDKVIFEEAPVKHETSKEIYIRNIGQTKSNSFTLIADDPFGVSPKEVPELGVGEGFQISLTFNPESTQVYTGHLHLCFDNMNNKTIRLEGKGKNINVKLESSSMNLPTTYMTCTTRKIMKLINSSNIRVNFYWKKFPTIEDEILHRSRLTNQLSQEYEEGSRQYRLTKREIENNELLFSDEEFTISPISGDIWPNSEMEITVEFHPTMEIDYEMIAFCDVTGRETRLPLRLTGKGRGPNVSFSYSELDIGEIFINSIHEYEVRLDNKGNIDAVFELVKLSSLFGPKFTFAPQKGIIPASESQLIKILFSSDVIGTFDEDIYFRVEGRKEDLRLHFTGQIVGPTFNFDIDEVNFGTVPFGFLNVKYVQLHNTCEIPMKFKLRVPEDGTMLQRQFDIIPSSGTILPQTKKQIKIEFLSNTLKQYRANLVVDVEGVGENIYSVPIVATCIAPNISVSKTQIQFDDCYIGFEYTKVLELVNSTVLPAKYEVILPSEEEKAKYDCIVDAPLGIISNRSTHKIQFTLSPKDLGAIEFPILIKILGSEKPPFKVIINANSIGPSVNITENSIDWGKVAVLTPHDRTIVLTNSSPIPAKFVAQFQKKSIFQAKETQGIIPPNSEIQFEVQATLDDTIRFVDEVIFDVQYGDKLPVKLIASGKGNTVIPTGESIELIDFGDQFTSTIFQRQISLENKGRKSQKVVWTFEKKDKTPVFKIIPDKVTIPPKTLQVFTIEGFSDTENTVQEEWTCKLLAKVEKEIANTTLKSVISNPLLKFSSNSLSFNHMYSRNDVTSLYNQSITVTNVSPLALSFAVKVNSPFSLEFYEHTLQANESKELIVYFDPSFKGDKQSCEIKSKMILTYIGHPRKDVIDLYGSINFPNLVLGSNTLDFGTVISDAEKSRAITIENKGKIEAHFSWLFEVEEFSDYPISQIFDILPMNGYIIPGEKVDIKFIYNPHKSGVHNALAICQVEGGPEYQVTLKGESSTVKFTVDNQELDYGIIPYFSISEKDILITNTGKVGIDYEFDFTTLKRRECIEVLPLNGRIKPGEKQKITIKLIPGLPEIINEQFTLTVALFEPVVITVRALSVYPLLYISSRSSNENGLELEKLEDYDSYMDIAQRNVLRGYSVIREAIRKMGHSDANLLRSSLKNVLLVQTELQKEIERLHFCKYLVNNPIRSKAPSRSGARSLLGASLKINEPNIVLQRFFCDFGTTIKGVTKKKSFKITNVGVLAVSLQFNKKDLAKYGLSAEPAEITNLPGYPENQAVSVDLVFQSKSEKVNIGELNAVIPVRISNGYIIEFVAKANVVLPVIKVSETNLNFGDVYVGFAKVYTIQICNEKEIASEWLIEGTKKTNDSPFIFSEMKGILNPGEKKNIEVTFIPNNDKKLSLTFNLKCMYNPNFIKINCLGSGKDVDVEFKMENKFEPSLPYEFVDVPLTITNKSDCSIDLYSIDFDEQFRTETEIIANCDNFDSGYILVKPREPGKPLNDEIVQKYNSRKPQELSQTPLEQMEITTTTDVSSGILEIPRKKFIFVVYGPPLSYKTAIAKNLASKLDIPIINLNNLFKEYVQNASEINDESQQPHEIDIFEKLLMCVSNRLSQPDCKYGVIFDDILLDEITDQAQIGKTLLEALKPEKVLLILLDCNENNIKMKNITNQVTNAKIKLEEARYRKISEEEYDLLSEEEKRSFETQVKRFRDCKQQLAKFTLEQSLITKEVEQNPNKQSIIEYLTLRKQEDEDFIKKQQEEEKKKKPKKKSSKGNRPETPPPELPSHVFLNEELTISPDDTVFQKNIKLYKQWVFEVKSIFEKGCVVEEVPKTPQGNMKKSRSTKNLKKKEETTVVDPNVYVFNVNEKSEEQALSEIYEVIPGIKEIQNKKEEETQVVTNLAVPDPFILQVIKKNSLPNVINKDALFTIVQKKDTELVSASRWIISGNGGSVKLFLRFRSKHIGKFESTLQFGLFGRNQNYKIPVYGICAFPEISTFHKNIFSRRVKTRPEDKLFSKKYIISEQLFEFGPLLIRPYENLEAKEAKNYYEIIRFSNIGHFNCEMSLALEKEDRNPTFSIEPSQITIPKEGTCEIKIWAQPKSVGTVKNSIICTVKNNPIPFKFGVSATGAKPRIELDKTKVDFGRILISNKTYSEIISIKNTATIPIIWSIKNLEALKKGFSIDPQEGRLNVGEKCDIVVHFNTEAFMNEKECEFEDIMLLAITDINSTSPLEETSIIIKADAFKLDVAIDNIIDYGTLKVYESCPKTISLNNSGKYDVHFSFSLPSSLQNFFTITPMEGILQSKAKQKTNVEVTFKTNQEINYSKNRQIICNLKDHSTQTVLGAVPIEVSVRSTFSRYSISPEYGINFGPLSYDKDKIRTFEIVNTGLFDINFNLFDFSKGLESLEERSSSRLSQTSKKKPSTPRNKSKKKIGDTLQLGQFSMQPTNGIIAPGGKTVINVTFKGDGAKTFQETLGIDISDRNLEDQPNGIAYYLQGESCVPGILTSNFESIFEEQQTVNSINMANPLHSVFSIDERIFSFGTIIASKTVTEKIKITNPFKVPCNVDCSIKPRDSSLASKDVSMFEATPSKLFIPPHEHRYVNLSFSPPTLNSYSAIFEALVSDGNDPKTKELRIEMRGEGLLPQVKIKKPEIAQTDKGLQLKFPRTLLGKTSEQQITIFNESILPATVRFDFVQHSSLTFSGKLEEFVLAAKETKTFNMTFEPQDPVKVETYLNMVVLDNHFEDTSIKIIAEGVFEDVSITNLPQERENELVFGDCGVKVKNERLFTLVNHSNNPIRFHFDTFEQVSLSPSIGHLLPKSSKDILATLFVEEPVELKANQITCKFTKIKYTAEESDWDDRHKSVRWIEVDEEEELRKQKELEELKQKEKDQKKTKQTKEKQTKPLTKKRDDDALESPKEDKPKKLITKRVEIVDPEPEHEILAELAEKPLKVIANADYSKFECDIQESILFSLTNMFEARVHPITLKNIGKVPFPYSWKMISYANSPFSISPEQGLLNVGEKIQFSLKYAPMDADRHEEKLICEIPNVDSNSKLPMADIYGQSKCPIVHFELPASDYLTGGRRKITFENHELESLIQKDKTKVVEFLSCGIKVKNTRRFFIMNPNDEDYEFNWKRIESPEENNGTEGNLVNCLTKSGTVSIGKKTEIIFEYVANTLETKESIWIFNIPSKKLSIPFLIVGHAKEPEVFLETTRMNFQTVLVGTKATQIINLINKEQIAFNFSFDQAEFLDETQRQKPILSVSPASGTVGPEQSLPLTISFTPTSENNINLHLSCRIKKKPTLLSCNVKGEGFIIHESIEIGDINSNKTKILLPTESNYIDFERTQINEKKIKRVALTNDGNFSYDYQWVHAKNKLITIQPEKGTVLKGGKQFCEIIFNPTSQVSLDNYKVLCKITNSHTYVLFLNGSGSQPKVHFNFYQYDFGPHFLFGQGTDKVPTAILKIENQDDKEISYEMLDENKPYLEFDATADVLKPGESKQIKIYFKPREIRQYKDTIMFEINGLYKTSVTINGEGTAARVELLNSNDRVINLGALKGGESVTKYVSIVNRSKREATFSFPPELIETLSKHQITVSPRSPITLFPKQETRISLTFKPDARIHLFNVELEVYVEGKPKILSTVSGSCQGMEVKLNTQTIAFGPIVQHTNVIQRAVLENTGDIGVNFRWNIKNMSPCFSVKPLQGYVPSGEDLPIEIAYSPTTVDSSGQTSKIECKIDGMKEPLYLTISGLCIEKPKEKESLTFKINVRKTQSKLIKIENPTSTDWRLKPLIENSYWSGPDYLEIPAMQTKEYEITYCPLAMTHTSQKTPHKGTLFFPLPDGKAILYDLTGETLDPLPSGNINREIFAKENHAETLSIENWLAKPQRFKVVLDELNLKPPSQINALTYVDIPPVSKREYKFNFVPYKEGIIEGKIKFINEETKEFVFYHLKYNVQKARSIGEILIETPLRQRYTKTITIDNPLDKDTTLTVKCDSNDIIVPSELHIPPKSQGKCDIIYMPLLLSEQVKSKLTIHNDELGVFPFDLLLKPLPKGVEKNVHFSVSLGSSQTQTIRFMNYARNVTDYICKIEETESDFAFSEFNGTISKVPASNTEGSELSFDVVYEPTMVGTSKTRVVVQSSIGGEYVFQLFGTCSQPKPQGPIEIALNGSATIPFKNIFLKKADFTFSIEDPTKSFTVKPDNLSLNPKQKTTITVTYKPPQNTTKVIYGKLTINCKGTSFNWLFYLLGKTGAATNTKK
ncbi:hypothetical protein ABK040_007361 [Willaertia magna]